MISFSDRQPVIRWIYRLRQVPVTDRILLTLAVLLFLAPSMLAPFATDAAGTIDMSGVRHVGGHAYDLAFRSSSIYDVPRSSTSDVTGARIRLYEDGRPLGPPHTQGTMIEQIGGGSYTLWGVRLMFSSSDGSDPRNNGRTYTWTSPRQVSLRLDVATRAGAVLLALIAAMRTGLAGMLWRWSKVTARVILSRLKARPRDWILAASIPTILSAALMLWMPPTWNMADSIVVMAMRLSTIPHYPPLYPHLLALLSPIGMGKAFVVVLQLVQHLLAIAFIAYMATAARTRPGILILSVAATAGMAFNLYQHGVFSEAAGMPALPLCFGAILRILWRGPDRERYAIFFLSIVAMMLSRQAFVIVGGILPTAMVALHARRLLTRTALLQIATATSLLVGGIVVGAVMIRAECWLLRADPSARAGLRGLIRMNEAAKLVPPGQLDAWIADMRGATDDPLTAKAIEIMMRDTDPWMGSALAIAQLPEANGKNVHQIMDQAFLAFLKKSADPYVRAQFQIQWDASFIPAFGVIEPFVASALATVQFYNTPERRAEADWYAELFNDHLERKLAGMLAVVNNPGFIAIDRWISFRIPMIVSAGLLVVLLLRRRWTGVALTVGCYSGVGVYLAVNLVLTIMLWRYMGPVMFTYWALVGGQLTTLLGLEGADGQRTTPTADAAT